MNWRLAGAMVVDSRGAGSPASATRRACRTRFACLAIGVLVATASVAVTSPAAAEVLGLAFTRWSLRKFVGYLANRPATRCASSPANSTTARSSSPSNNDKPTTLWGVVRARKSAANTVAALKSIRAARRDTDPVYVILDNLSAHKAPRLRDWAARNNVELCFTPTYSSWANPIEKRLFPTTATVGRWLQSTPLTVRVPAAAGTSATDVAPSNNDKPTCASSPANSTTARSSSPSNNDKPTIPGGTASYRQGACSPPPQQ